MLIRKYKQALMSRILLYLQMNDELWEWRNLFTLFLNSLSFQVF